MKKSLLMISVVLVGLLSACSTIGTVSFDRLQAADINFPEAVRKVGIVNYTPKWNLEDKSIEQSAGVLEGDGKVTAEALAQAMAETHYFDEVIICDTAIYKGEDWEAPMPKEMVDSLVAQLGVNMLFAVERVNIRLKDGSLFVPELMMPIPAVDGVVTPVVRAYVSGRRTPLFVVSKSDTISWELVPSLTVEQIVKDASEYAATLPVEHLLPHWMEVSRHYFDGGNVDMRDAGVCVREQDWEGASRLWQKVYDRKKGNPKLRAAFNLALYYEMQDNFEKAKEYLSTARDLAKEGSTEKRLIDIYTLQLDEQSEKIRQLQIQMKRFD